MRITGTKFYIEHEGQNYIVDQTHDQMIVFRIHPEGPWLALDVSYKIKTAMTPNMAVAAIMKAIETEAVGANCFSVDDRIPAEAS